MFGKRYSDQGVLTKQTGRSIPDIFVFFFLTAQTLTINSIPSSATYVKLGENLTLDVTYNYTGNIGVDVDWVKHGKTLIRKLRDGIIIRFGNERAFVKGEASLLLTNIELTDNGTYTVSVKGADIKHEISRDLIVIVQGKFFTASLIKVLIVVHTVHLLYGWWHIREGHTERNAGIFVS